MSDTYFALVTVVTLTGMFVGLSISLFVTFRLLKKYSDYGDSSCGFEDYSPWGLHFDRMSDDVVPEEKNHFFFIYADNPYVNIARSIPEQLLKNEETKRNAVKTDGPDFPEFQM